MGSIPSIRPFFYKINPMKYWFLGTSQQTMRVISQNQTKIINHISHYTFRNRAQSTSFTKQTCFWKACDWIKQHIHIIQIINFIMLLSVIWVGYNVISHDWLYEEFFYLGEDFFYSVKSHPNFVRLFSRLWSLLTGEFEIYNVLLFISTSNSIMHLIDK